MMADSMGIYRRIERLVKRHGTTDPFVIASESNIMVESVDYFNSLLGMYTCRYRLRAVFLNNKMDEYLSKMVLAHELGHDMLHREMAKRGDFREFELFCMKNSLEYEANVFPLICFWTPMNLSLCAEMATT